MSAKSNPSKFDCYENAAPDEPIFTLLARDRHAPAMIWLWATLREFDGESPEKVQEARMCMAAMIDWNSSRGRKSVGMGQAVLAGVLELIRASNAAVRVLREDAPKNEPTPLELMRLILSASEMEEAEAAQ